MDSKQAMLALHLAPGIGGHTIRQLISYTGTADKVFTIPKGKLLSIPGLGHAKINKLRETTNLKKAEEILNKAHITGTAVISYQDQAFPERLRGCYDAPVILFYKGNADLNSKRIISVVGTRKASRYGIEQTGSIIKGIKEYNPVIVSGLAYGVDICAHKTALLNEMATIGVMASGLNHVYPSVHASTAEKMQVSGGLLSEYSFEELPEPGKFPARNRIIAGLSDAVIVVEAAAKGGALITAEMANTYHREVFAVPGNNNIVTSEGCNLLIRNHKAHILTKPQDIPYILGWDKTTSEKKTVSVPQLENEEFAIWKILSEGKEFPVDELSFLSRIPLNRLASTLLSLEFKGVVTSLPGKRFKINH